MMKNKKLGYVLVVIASLFIGGCRNVNSSFMFRTPEDYQFAKVNEADNSEYRMAPNDIISFQVFSNDGFKLIDITNGGASVNGQMLGNQNGGITYTVEQSGEIKLPVIGKYKLSGLTLREAETKLEKEFAAFYNSPFVIIRILNKRVTIFPGAASAARVITLTNENTTVIEAIGLSGGLANTGKAWRVKLIRGSLKNPKVYLLDLSTLEGIKNADMFVQAGDIIYVEQVPNYAQGVLTQITPYISLLSSALLLLTFTLTLKKNI